MCSAWQFNNNKSNNDNNNNNNNNNNNKSERWMLRLPSATAGLPKGALHAAVLIVAVPPTKRARGTGYQHSVT